MPLIRLGEDDIVVVDHDINQLMNVLIILDNSSKVLFI